MARGLVVDPDWDPQPSCNENRLCRL